MTTTATQAKFLYLPSFMDQTSNPDRDTIDKLEKEAQKLFTEGSILEQAWEQGKIELYEDSNLGPILKTDALPVHGPALIDSLKDDDSKPQSSLKAALGKFMMNQTARFFQLLDLVAKLEPDAILKSTTDNKETLAIQTNNGKFIVQADTGTNEWESSGTKLKIIQAPNGLSNENLQEWLDKSPNAPSLSYLVETHLPENGDTGYHESGFDIGSTLHKFKLESQNGAHWTLEQGQHGNQKATKLIVQPASNGQLRFTAKEFASWRSDPQDQIPALLFNTDLYRRSQV